MSERFKPIWVEFAEIVVREGWGLYSPGEILDMVKAYSLLRAEARNGVAQFPSIGGIFYKAAMFGLITENEYNDAKKTKKATRAKVTALKRKNIKDRDGNCCLMCKSPDGLQIDHIRPVFSGGESPDENLQTLCKVCHKKKGANVADFRYRKAMPPINQSEFLRVVVASLTKEYIASVDRLRSLPSCKNHDHGFCFETTHKAILHSTVEHLHKIELSELFEATP